MFRLRILLATLCLCSVGLFCLPQEVEAGPLRKVGKAVTAPFRIFRSGCSRNEASGFLGGRTSRCANGSCSLN